MNGSRHPVFYLLLKHVAFGERNQNWELRETKEEKKTVTPASISGEERERASREERQERQLGSPDPRRAWTPIRRAFQLRHVTLERGTRSLQQKQSLVAGDKAGRTETRKRAPIYVPGSRLADSRHTPGELLISCRSTIASQARALSGCPHQPASSPATTSEEARPVSAGPCGRTHRPGTVLQGRCRINVPSEITAGHEGRDGGERNGGGRSTARAPGLRATPPRTELDSRVR